MKIHRKPGSLALRHRMHDDSGISAVVIAIFVVFLLIPISAFAIDLSNGYVNRRQMQNAADAASMAAADAFSVSRTGGESILGAASRVANANGGASVRSCQFVDVDYADSSGIPGIEELGPCDGPVPARAKGVKVTTERTVSTFFAPAMPGGGTDETSASAQATASLQKAAGGWAPFALCAYWDTVRSDKAAWPGPEELTVLLADGTINPDAVGLAFPVYGNGSSPPSKCGLSDSSWFGQVCGLGKIDEGACELTIPGEVRTDTGARVGPVLTTVAGEIGCTPTTIPDKDGESPCKVALPICSKSVAAKTLYCETWGAFELSYNKDAKAILAKLLGPATLTNSTGGSGEVGPNDAVVIGLVG